MELGTQIKKYRKAHSLSQEELAERIFVSRQSVSNWENGKTYPDLRSLLLLSDVFSVSLDNLVKGDLKAMKQEINERDRTHYRRESRIYSVLFVIMTVSAVPCLFVLKAAGTVVWLVLAAVCLYYSFRVEKLNKKFDIQTYREIVAFTEGKTLDEIEKAKELGKRPYQKGILLIASGLFGAVCALLGNWLMT